MQTFMSKIVEGSNKDADLIIFSTLKGFISTNPQKYQQQVNTFIDENLLNIDARYRSASAWLFALWVECI